MADKKENVQLEKTMDKAEQEKLESVKKADAAVKTMQDFTSPEVLYEELIQREQKEVMRKYCHLLQNTKQIFW